MLHVNVGLSRKLSRDYNSTGFSVNLDGEIAISLDDPAAVIEKIREYYDLADEALRDQMERYEGISAIASRDEERPVQRLENNDQENGNGNRPDNAATNKQVQYLLTIGKRLGLTKPQLENRIAKILGQRIGVYDLSKTDAGIVLDQLADGNGIRSKARS